MTDEERRLQDEELGRQRWNRMVRRDEQQILDEVVREATKVAKDAAKRR